MSTDMQRIAKAADKMSLLLDELLDLSRIGRGARQAEKINLTDIANEAVDIVAGQITKHGVDVKISDNLPVAFANRAQILTVFQNLLDNAVKFCSSAENPFVEIGSFEQNNEQICFVRDNGIGLDKKHFDKIFGLFDKLDNKTEGTGVGLALVKRIIEVHSGRIWVESDGNNQGSIFCFTIPAYSKTRK
jgi:signal transduction histidine kinase